MLKFRKWGSSRVPRRYSRFTWLLGFLGFLGCRYFFSHDLNDLFNFSYFALFSAYFTNKLAAEMPDERYQENHLRAKAAAMMIPAVTLFLIGLGIVWFDFSKGVIVLCTALGWSATFITYALAFWYYEKY